MARDPLEELRSRDAGVRELVSALVSAPTEDELSGEQAALALFAAFRSPPAPAQAPRASRVLRHRHRRPSKAPRRSFRLGLRLATAATAVALVGGFAVAGYAAVLPEPIRAALDAVLPSVLNNGLLGAKSLVQASQPPVTPTRGAHPSHRHHGPAGTGSPKPSPSGSHRASPSPSPSHTRHDHQRHEHHHAAKATHNHGGLSVRPSASQVPLGGVVRFAVTVTSHGKPVPDVPLRLVEYPAWGEHRYWQPPQGQTVTDQQGQASFTVAGFELHVNASFQVTGPGSLHSGKIKITVIPPVWAAIFGQWHDQPQDNLFANCPLAEQGDTAILEVLRHGHWHVVTTTQFHHFDVVVFPIDQDQANRTYRVIVPATKLHGRSVSQRVSGVSHDQYHWHQGH
jgi:hypothetical protein